MLVWRSCSTRCVLSLMLRQVGPLSMNIKVSNLFVRRNTVFVLYMLNALRLVVVWRSGRLRLLCGSPKDVKIFYFCCRTFSVYLDSRHIKLHFIISQLTARAQWRGLEMMPADVYPLYGDILTKI